MKRKMLTLKVYTVEDSKRGIANLQRCEEANSKVAVIAVTLPFSDD